MNRISIMTNRGIDDQDGLKKQSKASFKTRRLRFKTRVLKLGDVFALCHVRRLQGIAAWDSAPDDYGVVMITA
jgi:hypothetical protein